MPVKDDLDNPKNKFWYGFAKEAFDEGMRNTRLRMDCPQVYSTPARKFNNSLTSIMFTTVGGLALSSAYLVPDLNEHADAFQALSAPSIEATEDITAANGIIVTPRYTAVRNGEEFLLFERQSNSDNSTIIMRYVEDEDQAEAYIRQTISELNALDEILNIEQNYNVDLRDNNFSYAVEYDMMSMPFAIEGEDGTYINMEGLSRSDAIMSEAEITTQIEGWQTVLNSIEDGGYEGAANNITVTGELPPLNDSTLYSSLAAGFASFFGLAFLGGAGIATGRRLAQSSTKRPQPKIKPPRLG